MSMAHSDSHTLMVEVLAQCRDVTAAAAVGRNGGEEDVCISE